MIQHVTIHPDYEKWSPWLASIPARFEQEGRTIYDSRNRIKVFTAPDGTPVNVKRYHPPRWLNLLLYSTGMRKPKGLRAFHYPEILLKKNIETPAPMAYIEERSCGILGYSYFMSVQCPYHHTMYELDGAQEGTYEEIARAFAHYTAKMHDHQLLHRDYSPGNILWDVDSQGQHHFSVVDINRMYFGEVSVPMGCKNLCRIWGPKRFFVMVIRTYAEARGYDADKAERIALEKRAAFWKRYQRRHAIPCDIEL